MTGQPVYPAIDWDSAESGLGPGNHRRLSHLAEFVRLNMGDLPWDAKASSLPMPTVGVGAAIVVRGRESWPHGEGRQSVGSTEAEVAGCQRGGIVPMNIGEMQRLLS